MDSWASSKVFHVLEPLSGGQKALRACDPTGKPDSEDELARSMLEQEHR